MKFNKLYNLIEGIFEPASNDEIDFRKTQIERLLLKDRFNKPLPDKLLDDLEALELKTINTYDIIRSYAPLILSARFNKNNDNKTFDQIQDSILLAMYDNVLNDSKLDMIKIFDTIKPHLNILTNYEIREGIFEPASDNETIQRKEEYLFQQLSELNLPQAFIANELPPDLIDEIMTLIKTSKYVMGDISDIAGIALDWWEEKNNIDSFSKAMKSFDDIQYGLITYDDFSTLYEIMEPYFQISQ